MIIIMFFKKSDLIIIAIVIFISAAALGAHGFAFYDKPTKAEIYYYRTLVKTVSLNRGVSKTFSIPQNNNVIFRLSKDGYICFEKSDCPDKICVKSGRLHMVSETAACLPNGIFLKIVPEKSRGSDDMDIIAGK